MAQLKTTIWLKSKNLTRRKFSKNLVVKVQTQIDNWDDISITRKQFGFKNSPL